MKWKNQSDKDKGYDVGSFVVATLWLVAAIINIFIDMIMWVIPLGLMIFIPLSVMLKKEKSKDKV